MDKLEQALVRARGEREQALKLGSEARKAEPPEEKPAPSTARTREEIIPEETLERNRLVAGHDYDPNADAFRILRTKVMQLAERESLRAIAVTSPNYGDGKSTIALNLAISMSRDVKTSVCLVDLDLRRPSVAKMLGLQPALGLDDFLSGSVEVSDCLIRPNIDRLVIFPIRETLAASSESLGTPAMLALAKELKTRYPDRIVIYDMPPILAQDDVISFLPSVDGVLLVVREGQTSEDDLRRCLNDLTHATIIGTVLNASSDNARDRE